MLIRPRWIQLMLVALLLATPVLGAAAGSPRDSFTQSVAAAAGWDIETVDPVGSVGRYASLAVDVHGSPLISYHDNGTNDLKLARFGGTTWQIETVDSGMVYPCPTSLALDASGHPRISYCVADMAGGSDLWYAAYDGTAWQREMVTLETTPYASLAVDASGGPHIAFQAGHLRFASKVAGSWQVTSADSTPGTGPGVSLALDADDRPHISYLDGGSNQLKYAWHDGATWQVSTLDDGMLARGQTSLALDGSGYAHIAYGSFFPPVGQQGLAYTYFDGAAWHPGIADSEGDAGWHASLALDAAGRPHISHFDAETGDLKVAYQDGSGWHSELVDSTGVVGEYSSLDLDALGEPHIAYYDATQTNLKHAYVPFRFLRMAAQLLEDVRGTPIAPGWEQAQLAAPFRPLYRPDVPGIAYYEFPIVVPAMDLRQRAVNPAGYILVSTGDHDFTIPHWSFGGVAPTAELIATAEANGQQAVTFYQFNDASFAAENAAGDLVATLGPVPEQLTGMDPDWLADPPESASQLWVPDHQLPDQPVMPTISGTLVISGDAGFALDWTPWPSWQALKDGFADAYYVPLEGVRRAAHDEWEVKDQIARDGAVLRRGDIYTMALLWPGAEASVSGLGAAYVTTQLLPRDPLPPTFQITVVDAELGESLPLDVAVAYENGVTEVVRFRIFEPHSVWLPLAVRGAVSIPQMPTSSATSPKLKDSYGPWHYYRAGTHADQRLYTYIDEGEPPNTSDCISGCGATAWAMLYGWVDYKAATGDPYWQDRWGLYRVDGGYGDDAVAPPDMESGVKNMIWEIRNDINTHCVAPSQVGPDQAYTNLYDMKHARKYTQDRSCLLIRSQWNGVWTKKNRNRAIESIVERQTPAIMLTMSMDHYQLAYGYKWRCWNSAAGCLWRDHYFYVNQGWAGLENKWVYRYMTHYVGRVWPCSGYADDVALAVPATDALLFDYGHDGTNDDQRGSNIPRGSLFVAGDFDRDGARDDMGMLWIGFWWFDYNSNGATFDDFAIFVEYQDGDLPVAGDFDRDGFVDDIAIYRPSERRWYFDHDHDGSVDDELPLGCTGCRPATGDFNRDGFVDDIALYRDASPNWLIDIGHNGTIDEQFTFGCNGCQPLAGDFDRDGNMDDAGLYNPATYTWFYDYNHTGIADEIVGPWGVDGAVPVVGSFDGN